MAVYDLEEQEQLAEIKAWWKQHGNLVTGLVVAGSLAVVGWQGWNWYQNKQAAQASAVFAVVQKAAAENDPQRLKAATGELLENFGRSAYAPLGALIAAKASFEAGDLKTAKLQLTWVAEHGKDELQDLARLRLAAVLLDEKAYDEALKQVEAKPGQAYAARYAETKGDILLAQGKKAEARAAFQAALAALDANAKSGQNSLQNAQANGPYRQALAEKADALGDSK